MATVEAKTGMTGHGFFDAKIDAGEG